MEKFLIKLLFLPWLGIQEWSYLPNGSQSADRSGNLYWFLAVVILFLLLNIFLLPRFFRKRAKADPWPRFLRFGCMGFAWTFELGLLGSLCNFLVGIFNGQGGLSSVISNGLLSENRFVVNEKTRLPFLANCIPVNSSKLFEILFPPRTFFINKDVFVTFWYTHMSPGDLMIAASVILSWWIAILIAAWAIKFAIRNCTSQKISNTFK